MPLNERIAVVTGAGGGIGSSICELFREKGIRTIAVHRGADPGESARRLDITVESAVAELFAELRGTFGRIDILVNNAGIATTSGILDTGIEDWNAVLAVNLTGAFLCCKHALGPMVERGYGKIVNIGSIAGRSSSRTASVAYTCSKYGVIGLTRQLATEYAGHGINVNCVCPSQTRTPMLLENVDQDRLDSLTAAIPAGRLAEPADVAHAVHFLCTDEAAYINGAVLDVNGGQL